MSPATLRHVSTQDPDTDTAQERSGLVAAVEQVGDRWTLQIVQALLAGPLRFGALQDVVGGISPNILSQRLKQLEADGIVLATPYQQRPTRYQYELTAAGSELVDVLRLLARWGTAHAEGETVRHATCGTPAEVRWWCPTCERVIDPDEATDLHHL